MTSVVERSEIDIGIGDVSIQGDLVAPRKAPGLVLFAHGSGSGRKSPRNRYVAGVLNDTGLATLLIDLLTPDEEEADRWDGRYRFDIDLLTSRLLGATAWATANRPTSDMNIGYFGASTGAAAALKAAPRQEDVKAVVSRGGRPDLAGESLPGVTAPTLLIVGGHDPAVIDLNHGALESIPAREKKLVIVPGATHLFEEPGALEEVARLAADWFQRHLA